MINYTKRNVLIITLTTTILIYLVISVIIFNFSKKMTTNDSIDIVRNTQENIEPEESIQENIELNQSESNIWQIIIPKINLTANIAEGTTQKVIAKYVGHFGKTSILDGNVGLAAHNRGFGVESYFKNIKDLNLGDEIIYKKDKEIRKYEVTKNIIINETDWTYLQNTIDNRITLITCVENKPEYRRCIQATEIE